MLSHMRFLIRIAYRSVLRNKRRSFLTILAIASGLAGTTILAALARGVSSGMRDEAVRELTGHIGIHAKGYLEDPSVEKSFSIKESEVNEIFNDPNVLRGAQRVRVPGIVMSERESFGAVVVGISPLEEDGVSFIDNAIKQGRKLESNTDTGIVIGRRLADFLDTKLGKRIVLMLQDKDGKTKDRGFRIVGIFESELESTEKEFVFLGRKTLQNLLEIHDQISEISLLVRSPVIASSITVGLVRTLPELDVKSWEDLEPLVVAILRIQGGILWIFFLIVMITIGFGLMNTLFMSIFERMKEFGLLQAVGLQPIFIVLQVIFETFFLLIAGAILGNLIMVCGVWLLKDGVDISGFAAGTNFVGIRKIIYPDVKSLDLISANLVTLVVGILSAFYPAWKAGRLTPIEALRRT